MSTFQDVLPITRGFEFPIGLDKKNSIVKADLLQINHLLVSGITGSGKTAFIDSALLTLMLHNPPHKIRLIFLDTKSTEFQQYSRDGHLLIPTCRDLPKMLGALAWLRAEGEKRMRIFANCFVRDIISYNRYAGQNSLATFPRIVLVIDDLSTLLQYDSSASDFVKWILSAGRATGIHLFAIIQTAAATQTKKVSALFFSKMVFQTFSPAEYRLITGSRKLPLLQGPGNALFCFGASQIQVRTILSSLEESKAVLDANCKYSD